MQREYHTRNKDLIMAFLRAHPDTRFCASDLHRAMSASGQSVNLTTVYRNLERLTENGTLLKFKSSRDDACVYQYSGEHSRCDEHLHIQCGRCGKMLHLEGPEMERFSEAVLQNFGFSLRCGESLLSGLCEKCRT